MRRLMGWGLAFLGGLLFWMWIRGGGLAPGQSTPQTLLPSSQRQMAPEILVQDLGGAMASIPGHNKGPTLVVFWASW